MAQVVVLVQVAEAVAVGPRNGFGEIAVTGQLQVFGNELASGTFNVRLTNGLFELSLPSPGLDVNWGFGTVKVTGFARSDGTFSFTGSISTSGSVFGIVSWNGSVTVTANNSRLAGTFNGSVNVTAARNFGDLTSRVTFRGSAEREKSRSGGRNPEAIVGLG